MIIDGFPLLQASNMSHVIAWICSSLCGWSSKPYGQANMLPSTLNFHHQSNPTYLITSNLLNMLCCLTEISATHLTTYVDKISQLRTNSSMDLRLIQRDAQSQWLLRRPKQSWPHLSPVPERGSWMTRTQGLGMNDIRTDSFFGCFKWLRIVNGLIWFELLQYNSHINLYKLYMKRWRSWSAPRYVSPLRVAAQWVSPR